MVAYRTGVGSRRQLTWVDLSGTAQGTVGDPDETVRNPRLSPDGRRVTVERTVQGNTDLWVLDGTRTSRLTFDPARDNFPLVSRDGTRIVFRSNRTGIGDLYEIPMSGAGGETRLVGSDQSLSPWSWSPDGRFLLYQTIAPQSTTDLLVLAMVGEHTPSVFLKTPLSRGDGNVLAGWPVGGVPVERIGAIGNLRAAVCSAFA
jgi:Tol biopolymer transport system component